MDSNQIHPDRLTAASFRIGHGYDLHRLQPIASSGSSGGTTKPLVLGGVTIDHDHGPVSHSDGDAVLHAVTDAILGALGEPDIGQLFPDSDPQWKGADSAGFLREAVRLMRQRHYIVGNIDITVICQRPKISPHKRAIVPSIARLLDCQDSKVNIKGKSHEGVDAVGEGRAIEVHAVVLLHSEARGL